ncbi:hypothetical protein ACIQCR_11660 [Streptomyces sp. NPDC093249]|uniref:hypothetical protein n=1 Tax=unclassified Streptomyces TaxID=2593676 RepID=UPI00382E5AAC
MRVALSTAVVVCAVTAALPGAASAETRAGADVATDRATTVGLITAAPGSVPANGDSTGASITPDGRHIVFQSGATNLTSDTPSAGDAPYLRDQQTGLTKRVSSQTPLQPPTVSGDGQYAAYPLQWMRNVRIRLEQVATGSNISADCQADSCNQVSLSADGRYVVLVVLIKRPGFSDRQRIEVQDLVGGGKQTIFNLPHTFPSLPSISGDGRYVAYQDAETHDVYLRDRVAETIAGPIEGPAVNASFVQLSDDASKIVYRVGVDTYVHDVASGAAQLVPNVRGVAIDPTGRYLLYAPTGTTGPSSLTLRELRTGADESVSDQPASAGVDAVSSGGHDVVFHSAADGIVPGDTNGKSDVFVRHFS